MMIPIYFGWLSFVIFLFCHGSCIKSNEKISNKNIIRDSEVIFASGFEEGFEGWALYPQNVCEIVNDPEPENGGNQVLKITATRNKDTGGEAVYRLSKGVDQLYLRFYTFFPDSTVIPHHFVKIRAYPPDPYFGGYAGKKPKGNDFFSIGIEPTLDMKWHFYAYWHKMRSWQTYEGKPDPARGENAYYGNTFNPGHQSPFSKNTWICVEAMVKANDPGKSNGEMAFWINGVKQGEWKRGQPMGSWVADKFVTSGKDNTHPQPFEGFDFRLTDSLKINQIALQFYVSKEYAQRGNASRNVVYFDDVVVAQHYIGPKDQ